MSKSTVFVAVHGIGDQVRNETIQAVARHVFANAGEVSALPLGAFPIQEKGATFEPLFPRLETENFGNVGFAEVYWADVTRKVEEAGYTLEESKRWARTLVQRIEKRAGEKRADIEKRAGDKLPTIDYSLMQRVLDEIIDTLNVGDRLLGLARSANLGQFDLKRVLDQFLGDVQFFTDFERVRKDILNTFNEMLEAIHDAKTDADIVLVAHSEGTVVAFMGLLLAAAGKDASGGKVESPAWLSKVTALMTLGSPIDKHLILWPELWKGVSKLEKAPENAIAWWNYFDNGDPVGAELDQARKWLEKHGKAGDKPLFDFTPSRDLGFTRYPFPGKAHVEYWKDEELFEHFLNSVALKSTSEEEPGTKAFPWLVSYVVPYLAAAGILFGAVYALSKGAAEVGVAHDVVFVNLIGYTSLLAGVTIFSRVPRLVCRWWGWLVGGLAFAAGAIGYHFTVVRFSDELIAKTVVAENLLWGDGLIPVAFAVAVIGTAIGRWKPRTGMKALVCAGTIAAVLLVLGTQPFGGAESQAAVQADVAVNPDAAEGHAFWPVLVGGAFFLYLWWLSALLFDLVFVWHRNVRHGATDRVLAQLLMPEEKASTGATP